MHDRYKKNYMRNIPLLFHPVFIISLCALLLNDFYLKSHYGNILTGKLSDFSGLIVFPIFFAVVFPSSKKWITLVTAGLFLLWKTPVVTPIIDWFNTYAFFTINRVIDYTDYLALLILPMAHRIINTEERNETNRHFMTTVLRFGLLGTTGFAICATSQVRHLCKDPIPSGTVFIGKKYTIKQSKEAAIQQIKSMGYDVKLVTSEHPCWYDTTFYYQTDHIIAELPYDYPPGYYSERKTDTIVNVKYKLIPVNDKKVKIEIINVTLTKNDYIQNWRVLKNLSERYETAIRENFVEKMK